MNENAHPVHNLSMSLIAHGKQFFCVQLIGPTEFQPETSCVRCAWV